MSASGHVAQRMRERYGIALDRDLLKKLTELATRQAATLLRQNGGRSVKAVDVAGRRVFFVFNELTQTVLTVITREHAASLCHRSGLKLSKKTKAWLREPAREGAR